jgi:hypothetical protein
MLLVALGVRWIGLKLFRAASSIAGVRFSPGTLSTCCQTVDRARPSSAAWETEYETIPPGKPLNKNRIAKKAGAILAWNQKCSKLFWLEPQNVISKKEAK